MRNLKRVLSLALALVMMLGMMIVGASAASADFPDAAEISYTEAVDVISGLGIMIGDDNGNFNPDAVLTREQAAKIICYTLIGEDNAEKLGTNTQIFTDVAAGRWSAGYIAYCANLGILVGDGNGLFRPEDELTGVQFGKMLLVAAGYNADVEGYVGTDWATNIATDMIDNDLDIDGVVMSNPLTREQAAQMLLQAMDVNMVEYVTGNVVGLVGPFATGKTFMENYFPKLEKINGVVTANEYASLTSSKSLAAGKTTIGGTTYKGSTELTDIGESRVGWANNGTILYLADSGKNTVYQTGAETELDAKFKKANGITADTEYFRNFDYAENVTYTSDYRIEYVLEGLKYTCTINAEDLETEDTAATAAEDDTTEEATIPTAVTTAALAEAKAYFADFGVVDEDGEYTFDVTVTATAVQDDDGNVTDYDCICVIKKNIGRAIRAGETITSTDMGIIQFIFDNASTETEDNKISYVLGEVYVGTQSYSDISDDISYKQFVSKYIDDGTDYAKFGSTDNGDWLKVIDNDGDGVADYVFLTEFTMEEVNSVSKKGVLSFTGSTTTFGGTSTGAIPYVTSEDELVYGDIVLYTEIDGTAYVELAPSFTGEVDQYSYKNVVLTVDDVDYEQSGIVEHTGYLNVLEAAEKETNYTYYQDFFGYIRIFAEPDNVNGDLVLLTDAYYETGKTSDDAAVKAYLDDAVGTYDVNTKKTGSFIDTDGDDNDWGNLNVFGVYTNTATNTNTTSYADKNAAGKIVTETNVARYTESNGVLSLSSAKTYTYDKKGEVSGINTDYVDLDEQTFKAGETDFDGVYTVANADTNTDGTAKYSVDADNVIVQANKNTVFYYVSRDSKGNPVVDTVVVGYKNTIAVTEEDEILSMYAVATNVAIDSGLTSETNTKSNYWVADVIVIETKEPVATISKDVALVYNVENKTYSDYAGVEALNSDAEDVDLYVISLNGDNYNKFEATDIGTPKFYTNSVDADGDSYLRLIDANYASYGIYAVSADRVNVLYEYFKATDGETIVTIEFNADTLPVYDIVDKGTYNILDDDDGDLAIKTGESYIVYTSNGEAVYAIHITDKDDPAYTLYQKILEEQTADTYTITVDGYVVRTGVEKGYVYTLQTPAKAVGTGASVTIGDGEAEYYKYTDTITVTGDVEITTGYVAWTLVDGDKDGDLVVPVAYNNQTGITLSSVFTGLTGPYVEWTRASNYNDKDWETGHKTPSDTLKPLDDTTFEDGYSRVTIVESGNTTYKYTNTGSYTYENENVDNADAEVVVLTIDGTETAVVNVGASYTVKVPKEGITINVTAHDAAGADVDPDEEGGSEDGEAAGTETDGEADSSK